VGMGGKSLDLGIRVNHSLGQLTYAKNKSEEALVKANNPQRTLKKKVPNLSSCEFIGP
jgi:hypothetical protein